MGSAAGGCSISATAMPCGSWQTFQLPFSPGSGEAAAALLTPSHALGYALGADLGTAHPHGAPVIYFSNRAAAGGWQWNLEAVRAGSGLVTGSGWDLRLRPCAACAQAQLSTDICLVLLLQDARPGTALTCWLKPLCRAGCSTEGIWISQQAAATVAKPRVASPAPSSHRDGCSTEHTSCLCKPCDNAGKSWGCCDLLRVKHHPKLL